jgi:alpha-glucosidase (family GH31 glycosyl hydrolase)
MYPDSLPIIRSSIKRRYELIPYLYHLSIESHRTGRPMVRWTGYDHESDSTVWKHDSILRGEDQFWLGECLLIGGVYGPGCNSISMYLPSKDSEYISLHKPFERLRGGQWVNTATPIDNIAVFAKLGGAIPVGRDVPTKHESSLWDHVHALDDYRGVEIFPPLESSPYWYETRWYEDDGISAQAQFSVVIARYRVTSGTTIEFQWSCDGPFKPTWSNLTVILPMMDQRKVETNGRSLPCKVNKRGHICYIA